MARILFIHQNFPGQFRYLAPALAADGHDVVALGMTDKAEPLPGVRYVVHQARVPADARQQAPQLKDLYSKVLRGESAAAALLRLKQDGFTPDIVFVHPGWGEALYVKDVFPRARMLIYAEYYYQGEGATRTSIPSSPARRTWPACSACGCAIPICCMRCPPRMRGCRRRPSSATAIRTGSASGSR